MSSFLRQKPTMKVHTCKSLLFFVASATILGFVESVPKDIVVDTEKYQRQTEGAVVEAFAFVDSVLANRLGDDATIYKYISASYNSINRRYRELQNPTVTVKLVGVKIARSFRDESFIIIHKDGVSADWWTRWRFAQWLKFSRDTIPPHDFAFLHLGRDLKQYAGVTYLGELCYDVRDQQRGTAIGTDFGYFDGIKVVAHELGHTLNCLDWDGDGSNGCPQRTGNVMNGQWNENMATLSDCSKKVIQEFVTTKGKKCLYDLVGSEAEIKKIDYVTLPGDLHTVDWQCQKMVNWKESTHVKSGTDCSHLECTTVSGGTDRRDLDPVTGNSELCPSGQRCLDAVCK